MPAKYRPPPSTRDEFDVAILCAKKDEWNAVEAAFDEKWKQAMYGKSNGDDNAYLPGRIGNHNVVLAYLPGMGTANSGSAASGCRASFTRLRLGLVVGICGGVPFIDGREGTRTEVLLGDVIISTRVLQYRFGSQDPDHFQMKDTLDKARPEIRAFLNSMESNNGSKELQLGTSTYLSNILEQKDFKHLKYPGTDRDRLYGEHHRHKHHEPNSCVVCNNCKNEDSVCEAARKTSCEALGCHKVVDRTRLVEPGQSSARAQIPDPELLIHFGAVASGDLVMRSGHHREEAVSLQKSNGHNVIAFEMESAGVWEKLDTIVIKGVSDYADSHKRDEWQKFAAARAAACMKATLDEWTPIDYNGPAVYQSVNVWPAPQNHMMRDGTRESSRSDFGDKIDRAEALIEKRDDKTMIKDLDEARRLLEQVLDQSETLSSHSLHRVYWGLMIAEKELSCHRSFNEEDKISHIDKAKKWNSKLLSQNLETGPSIHVDLERYIIQGRKVSLELRRNSASVEAKKSKVDAIEGIDRTLEELKEKDPNKYYKVMKHVQQWRASIIRTSS